MLPFCRIDHINVITFLVIFHVCLCDHFVYPFATLCEALIWKGYIWFIMYYIYIHVSRACGYRKLSDIACSGRFGNVGEWVSLSIAVQLLLWHRCFSSYTEYVYIHLSSL